MAHIEPHPRMIVIPLDDADAVRTAAWNLDRSFSSLVREGVADILQKPERIKRLPKDPGTGRGSGRGEVRVGIKFPVGGWERLREVARQHGMTPTQLTRRIIAQQAAKERRSWKAER